LVAVAQQPEGEAVVPEGQEELLSQMLGKGQTLAGCKLKAGQIEYSTMKATYECPSGDVVFELTHPSKAPGSAKKTDRFALVLQGGTPPDGLVQALMTSIHSRESSFEWKWLAAPPGQRSSGKIALAVAALAAIALLGWFVRSRSSSRPTDSR
jgi:hypothetical protein